MHDRDHEWLQHPELELLHGQCGRHDHSFVDSRSPRSREAIGNDSRFDDLATFMRDQGDGWKIGLASSERVIVNGFVVGGIAGFGSHTPTTSVCEFDGRSRQYYPYYLTGTVPYIPGGTFMYSVYVDSGGGLPSIPAVHIDSAGNVKLFLQKSTGEIKVLEVKQAQAVTGGLGAGGECN